MATEVGVAYVSVVPEARGFAQQVSGLVSEPLGRAGEEGGTEGGKRFGGSFKKVALASVTAVGVAGGALLAKGLADGMDVEAANDKLAAQLGATPEMAGNFGKIAGKLYTDTMADSMEQANAAIKEVWTKGLVDEDATSEEIHKVSEQVLGLANTMDQDLGGTANAVGQMIKTGLAQNATEAMDLLTRGIQQGADKAGDLMDTMNEYGTQFRKLGLDGASAMGLISQGLRGGARDADLVADALKEFSIRAIDGSKASAAGYKALGLSAEKMTAQIAKGGPEASAGLQTVLERLKAMKDPAAQSAAAVALFGTQAEDLGAALYKLDPTNAVADLGDVAGAIDKVNAAAGDNAKAKIEGMKRSFDQLLVSAVNLPGPLGEAGTALSAIGPQGILAVGAIVSMGSTFAAAASGIAGSALLAEGSVLRSFASMAAGAVSSTATAIAQLIIQGARWLWLGVTAMANAAVVAAAWLLSIWPIALIIAAVVGLVAVIVLNWDRIKKIISDGWNWVSEKTSAAWNAVWSTITGFCSRILGFITGAWNSLTTSASQAWQAFGNIVVTKTGEMLNFVRGIPGKVLAGIGRLGSLLVSTGRDMIQGMIDGAASLAGAIVQKVKDIGASIVNGVKSFFGIHSPSTVMAEMGGHIMTGLVQGIVKNAGQFPSVLRKVFNMGAAGNPLGWLASNLGGMPKLLFDKVPGLLEGMLGKAGGLIGKIPGWLGSMFGSAAGGGQLGNWIGMAMALAGVPASWAGPLRTLIMRESGGNPNAINLWDSNAAAGHPSQGLMQTIPSTFAAYRDPRLPNKITDPIANIVAGIRYIKARYGSIFAVQQAVGATPKGYDSGGWLIPGATIAVNKTGSPEAILTASQWDDVHRLATNTAGATNVRVYIGDMELRGLVRTEIASEDARLARTLQAR